MNPDAHPRKALVTGGSGSIGRECVAALQARGFDVAFTFVHDDERVDELRDLGAQAIRADFLTPDFERDVPTSDLDVVVHCAGINIASQLLDSVSLKDWDATQLVNVRAPFILSRAALPGMIRRAWGRFVFIGSIYSVRGSVLNSPYNTSKHALSGLMKSIAKEYAAFGITSNEVLPAAVRSSMLSKIAEAKAAANGVSPEEYLNHVASSSPRGQLVEPSDVSATVAFLCSEESAAVNGVSLVVDGGQIA